MNSPDYPSPSTRRSLATFAVGMALLLSPAAEAAGLPGSITGESYGTYVVSGAGAASIERTYEGRLLMTCVGTDGQTVTKTINNVSVGAGLVFRADKIVTTLYSVETATTAQIRDTSTIFGLSALNGLITADKVVSVAALSAGPHAITVSADGSMFANLKIAGKAIPLNEPRNTQINVPNLGVVTVNAIKVGGTITGSARSISVQIIRIAILHANAFNLPVGSSVTIGSAFSRFDRGPFDVFVGRQAFGTGMLGTVSPSLQALATRTALLNVGCEGTAGKTLTVQADSRSVSNLLSTGTVTDTGKSEAIAGGTMVTISSNVENASMLAGLITATSIHAVAVDKVQNGTRVSSAAGSTISGLKVAGLPVSNVSPNRRINLPAIGYVIVNEQTFPPATSRQLTQVNGLHIHITTANALGLPVGAEILVGHAGSLAYPVQAPAGP